MIKENINDIMHNLNNMCERCARAKYFNGTPCIFLKNDKHCQEFETIKKSVFELCDDTDSL